MLAASLLLTAGNIVTGLLVSVTVIARRPRRRTTDELTFRHIPMPGKVDWNLVRTMELECLGDHYHRADGSTKAGGWEPVGEEIPAEPYEYVAAKGFDRKQTHSCYSCGLPTMRQTYDGKWKCGDCICTGRLDCSCKLCRQAARYRERATDYLSKRGEEIRAEGMRELEEMDKSRSYADSLRADMARSFGYVWGSIEP